jgi:SET and MYND domain-containing protein
MSFTNKQYFENDLIMKCWPIVHFLFNKHKGKLCDFCVSLNKSLKKCSNCRKMYYCDRNCQRNDWKWHKFECDLYHKYYKTLKKHAIERILLRLFLFIESDPNIMTQFYDLPNGQKRCLNDLMTHFDEIQKDNERQSEIIAIKKNFEKCKIVISVELLTKLFGILVINSFGIAVKTSVNSFIYCGSGLYVLGSVLDHSCDPNVYVISDGNCLEIRAMKNIATNDKLLISYIDTKMPKQKRQSELKSKYYFDCSCSRCESEDKDQ